MVITNLKLGDARVGQAELQQFLDLAEKLVVLTGYPTKVLNRNVNHLEKPISPRALVEGVL